MQTWSVGRGVAVLVGLLVACQSAGGAGASSAADEPGADAALQRVAPDDLTPREQRDWRACLHRFPSPCPQNGHTVAECLAGARACAACGPAAEFVATSIRAGHAAAQVEARYLARFDPARVKVVSLEGVPTMGPNDAAVTILEFADFECPFCGAAVPLVDKLVEAYAPHVRVAFRHYPIPYHLHAELAAHAAVAAQAQGKFWQMHHALFDNRTALERADIEGYARSLGLDVARFVRDLDAPDVAQKVRNDHQAGTQLGVGGTPAFFINGRAFDFDLFDFGGEDLSSWIELEIQLTTGKPFAQSVRQSPLPQQPTRRVVASRSHTGDR